MKQIRTKGIMRQLNLFTKEQLKQPSTSGLAYLKLKYSRNYIPDKENNNKAKIINT